MVIKRILSSFIALGFALGAASRLQAQTFAPIPAISFTKSFGGLSNPLPQILTPTSTGASFKFNVSDTTTTGGSWLTVSPSGTECCATPEAITVSVDPSVSLAVGSYQGQVTFVDYSNAAITLTVPVTLTITTPNTPFFDDVPGQLSFSFQPGGSSPPQSFQVRNGASSGTLNWTLSASTADGGGWLTASPSSGTSPSTVTVTVTPGKLPGGGSKAATYTGQVLLAASGQTVTVPISVAVGDPVLEQVNPLNFTMLFGGANPLPQIVTVGSTSASIRLNAGANTGNGGAWLQISPSGGECCNTPEGFTVSVSASTLPIGAYTGQLTFTDYFGGTEQMTVPVTLTVVAKASAYFDNMPGQLSFSLPTGGATAQPQTMQVRNAGSGTLNWTVVATTANAGNWLSVTPSGGTAPSTVTVSINPAQLPNGAVLAGTFTGQLLFQTAGDNVTVPISVAVGDPVLQQVNPLSFTMLFGKSNPLPQIITVASTDASANIRLNVSAATANGGSWLSVSPSGGECCTTPEAFTVSVNASTLPAGSYTGEITFTNYFGDTEAMTVPVTLVIATGAAPIFGNLPGQLSFSMGIGDSAPAESLRVTNGGSGTLNWTLSESTSDGGNWLSVSRSSGTAPDSVAVSITTANLPNGGNLAGTFSGQLVFQTPGDSVTIPVSVTVGSPVLTQVNPVSFVMKYGGPNPLPQIITVPSNGSSIRLNVSAATSTGGNWLTVSPSGDECCNTPEAFEITVNAASLAAGTYTGDVTFTDYFGNTEAMTVPVTLLVVKTGPYFDDLPGQLSFSFATGATSPSQSFQVRNAGTGTLSWAVSASTGDLGDWLVVSPSSGAAPTTVTVSVNPEYLPNNGLIAGTFTGQLVFQSATGSVTVPISVTVGDPVPLQLSPLSFVMPVGGANPLPQTITFASTSSSIRVNVEAETGNGGSWLQVTPSGDECCNTPEAFTVSVNATSLSAGTYTGQVNFTDYFGNTQAITVPVTLTVAASGSAFFDNMQGQISYSVVPSGTNPPAQTVQVRNGGLGTLDWTVTASTADNGKWLGASPARGAAPGTVIVRISLKNLPGQGVLAGIYVGQLLFQSKNGNETIPVSVSVGTDVFNQLSALSFSETAGVVPPGQVITVSSTDGSIRFNSTANAAKGGNWLQVSPSGSECCNTPETITVSINPAVVLSPGAYTGQLVFTNYYGNAEATTVPVSLNVSASAFEPLALPAAPSSDDPQIEEGASVTESPK